MSNRLTKEWTPDLKGAYGTRGEIARAAEIAVIALLRDRGFEVIDHENDYNAQISGVDISVKMGKRWYRCDIKANLHDGIFIVEQRYKGKKGWLYKTGTDFMLHYDTANKDLIGYNISAMRKYVEMEGRKGLINTKYSDHDFIIKL